MVMIFAVFLLATVVLPPPCSSAGLKFLSETNFHKPKTDPSATPHTRDYHPTPPPQIPDLKHHMEALHQQSILTDLANLLTSVKKNLKTTLQQVVSSLGTDHPASTIISHVLWLLENSSEAQHSFDGNGEADDEQIEDDRVELEARGGFSLGVPGELQLANVGAVESARKSTVPRKLIRLKRSNSQTNLKPIPDPSAEKPVAWRVNTMTV